MLSPVPFKKQNSSLLTITSLHIFKIISHTHRGTFGPNSPFIPNGCNKWCSVCMTSNWHWVHLSGYQGSQKMLESMATLFWHMEHRPFPPRLWTNLHHNCYHSFSVQARQGWYGKGLQIKVPTVAKALSAIITSIHMVGKYYPIRNTEDDYIFPIKLIIEGLHREYPPPYPTTCTPYQHTEWFLCLGPPNKITLHESNRGNNYYCILLSPSLWRIHCTQIRMPTQWYLQTVHVHKAVHGSWCGFLESRLSTSTQLTTSPTPSGRLYHPLYQ